MKKILFNDKYGLTESVLNGSKTMTRRVCKYNRPNDDWEITFPVFEPKDYDSEGNNISPLNYAFGWKDKEGDFTGWNIPKYKVGEIVTIAQSYKNVDAFYKSAMMWKTSIHGQVLSPLDCISMKDIQRWYEHRKDLSNNKGWNNKMFVCADLMPHQIQITNIRIEKLQDISEEDCLKEGVIEHPYCGFMVNGIAYKTDDDYDGSLFIFDTAQESYAKLINKISGKGTWESNPYVFVYDFKLIK